MAIFLPLAQHEREMLVGAFLDVTLDRFMEVIGALPDEQLDLYNETPLAHYVEALSASGDGSAEESAEQAQLAVQSIALMSDGTLYEFVELFGILP